MSDRILSRDENRWSVMEVGTLMMMIVIILITIGGNVMVVMSVFTYKPLRNVQNFYIVSLACTDLMLATLVMPFHVTYWVVGRWTLGHLFCNVWATCDVLMCTASILNLCAIAIDRYYAIHDPIRYAQKRTMKRVLVSILVVWSVSILISMPPLVGWFGGDSLQVERQTSDLPLNDVRQKLKTSKKTSANEASSISAHDFPLHKSGIISGFLNEATTRTENIDLDSLVSISNSPYSSHPTSIPSKHSIKPRFSHRKSLYNSQDLSCELSAHPIYVVYSAAGSFYIPLLIMFLLYVNIYLATKARLRRRTKLGKRLLMSVAPQKSLLSKKSFPENLLKFRQNGKALNEKTIGEKDRSGKNNENKERTSESNLLSSQKVDTEWKFKTNSLLADFAELRTEKLNKKDEDSLTSFSSPSAQIEDLNNHQKKAALNSDLCPLEGPKTFPAVDDLRKDHIQSESTVEPAGNVVSETRVKRPTTLAANNIRGGTGTLRNFLEEKQRISLSLERRAARTMGIIMGAFVVCWLPFFVCYVVMPFCPSCSQSIDQSFISFFVWLGYINSAINPLIYTIFNIDYRRAFRNILMYCI